MAETGTIGIDLAKSVFQLHGVDGEGRTVLRRSQMLEFFQRLPLCLIGMEACAGAHHRAREMIGRGHEMRPMQHSYVKGCVKRARPTQPTSRQSVKRYRARPCGLFP